jgi:hypothetical protein
LFGSATPRAVFFSAYCQFRQVSRSIGQCARPNQRRITVEIASGSGLRELMYESSWLSREGESGDKPVEVVFHTLLAVLQQDEVVLAYADRSLSAAKNGALGSPPVGYRDVILSSPDYPEGEATQTDALAYARAPRGPETDAFISPATESPIPLAGEHGGGGQAESRASRTESTDVDLLMLTDRRLIRGLFAMSRTTVTQVPWQVDGTRIVIEPAGDFIQAGNGEGHPAIHLAVHLPALLRRAGEGEWWQWRLPEHQDPWVIFERWSGALR